MIKALLDLEGNDINKLALFAAQRALADYRYEVRRYKRAIPFDWSSPIIGEETIYKSVDYDWSEVCTVALTFRNILWEVKEYGDLQTHPEDLLGRAACNMRAYEYRGYRGYLNFICRAFARQFGDFDNLPRRSFSLNYDWCWLIYSDGSAARRDYDVRWFKVSGIHSRDEFDNPKDFLGYYVCEGIYGLFPYDDPSGKEKYYDLREFYKVVPFSSADEAKFFIAQLVDLLNTGYKTRRCNDDRWCLMDDKNRDDYIIQTAAQLIRDTLAQAPVEETRMREEEEAKRRAEQLEKERVAREKAAIAANKRAEQDRKIDMRGGDHVYIIKFEPLLANADYIKIGHSVDVTRRSLEVKGGLDIHAACCTKAITNSRSLQLEKQCHEHFADRAKPGQKEYFFVPYEEACNYLRSQVDDDLIVINE